MSKLIVKKNIFIEDKVKINDSCNNLFEKIKTFLSNQGYKEIEGENNNLFAIRGNRLFNLINIGDPRRHYHSLKLHISENELNIKISIESWFAIFSENDIEIFKVENSMLKSYLETESINNENLLVVKNKIRKIDFRNILLIILIVIALVTIFELIF